MANEYLMSHWPGAKAKLAEVEKAVAGRKVVRATIIGEGYCLESYPCQHPRSSLELELDDGVALTYSKLCSVQMGVIQAHYSSERTHFSGYADGYEEWAAKQ